jgi:hypothetical protein
MSKNSGFSAVFLPDLVHVIFNFVNKISFFMPVTAEKYNF